MKHFILFFCCLTALAGVAQPQQQSTHETAFGYMRTGDFDNAILVLQKGLQQDGENEQLRQDMAQAYFFKKDYAKAREQVEILMDRKDIDVISFQIAGNVYKALEEVKEADKMYRKALKKYPKSGALYNEYGEVFWAKKDNNAIKFWEKGIEMDPAYPGNYYNAATYYYLTKDKIWTVIYGEIFVNMEYLTDRATEIKKVLLAAYKEKLFSDIGEDNSLAKSPFVNAVQETFDKQSSLVRKGLNVQTLTMLRTKFNLDWFAKYGEKFPYKLFEYQQQLIKAGMFDAYNEWLFGPVENLPAFDQWVKSNATQYKKFIDWQRNRVFKMPQGQFYQVAAK